MKLRIIIVVLICLIGDAIATLGNGVLDLNIFKCVWKKSYNCPHEHIDFILYTPKSKVGKLVDVLKPNSLKLAGFRPHEQTAFIVHGFNGSYTDTHMRYLKDAYISRDFNVVMVNWQRLTFYPCYVSAISNTRLVGQCTAQTYAFLTQNGQSQEKITCVGHSLGAHICGMVSNHLTSRQHRIIGLDPAKPLIENTASRSFRLTRDDANFVQVIHTNAGSLGQISFSGTLDLCINGGKSQPFCRGNPIRRSRCSHFLSVCYLANAIFKHKLFPFVPCPSGCRKNNGLAGFGIQHKEFSLIGRNRTSRVRGGSSLAKFMHIGQDVPEETFGAFCVKVDFAKHCPFND